ncbi:fibronectin type III domain-containing protein [Paenibacillus aurantiacus]|uniref:Fibronectin type III domain-containing protein n=1 Tax=Paenibacillus aurantiacus TaxID=1936118 RepID=A0ABV5KYL3_9BACL
MFRTVRLAFFAILIAAFVSQPAAYANPPEPEAVLTTAADSASHPKPVITVDAPFPRQVATPTLPIKASCQDALGYLCKIKVEAWDNQYLKMVLVDYKPTIDEVVSLEPLAGKEVTRLVFTAVDSLGQTSTVEQPVYLEASPNADKLLEVENATLLDVDFKQGRVLFYDHAAAKLGVKQLDSGSSVLIPAPVFLDDKTHLPKRAVFTGDGVAFQSTIDRIVVWSPNKPLMQLESTRGCLKANGDYLLYCKPVTGPTNSAIVLHRLSSGIEEELLRYDYHPDEWYSFFNDMNDLYDAEISDDGRVLLSFGEGYTEAYDVQFTDLYLYQSGQLQMISDKRTFNSIVGFDGGDIVYYSWYPGGTFDPDAGEVIRRRADGQQQSLGSGETIGGPWLQDGWVAYSHSIDLGDWTYKPQLIVISPDGTTTVAEEYRGTAVAAGGNGDIAHRYDGETQISHRYGDKYASFRAANMYAKLVWHEDSWYSMLGGALFKISVPEEGNDPIWPGAGSEVTASNETETTIDLHWPAAADDSGVAYYELLLNDFTTWPHAKYRIAKVPGSATSFTIDRPKRYFNNDGYTYEISVRAVDIYGNYSTTIASPTLYVSYWESTAPVWPNGSAIQASGTSASGTTLAWNAAEDNKAVTGYRIFQGPYLIAETTADVRTLDVTGLTQNSLYLFKVEAGDKAGNWTVNGPSVHVRPIPPGGDGSPPTWPAGSKATSGGTTTAIALISWTAATDDVGVTGYRILNGTTVVAEVDGNTRSKGITGLNTNRTYTFKVEARDAAGNWSTDGPSVTVTTLPPGGDVTAPTWPEGSQATAADITERTARINWTAAADNESVTGYRITDGEKVLAQVDGNTFTIEIKGLTAGTNYSFKIEARDAAGNWSTDGPAASFETTPPDTAPPTWPAGSKATTGGTTTTIALISWTPASDNVGVTGYRIMNGTIVVAEVDGNTRTKGMTGLNTNRTYTFKVEARDAAGNWSADGPSVTVTTLPLQ